MNPDPMADLLTETLQERTAHHDYPTTSMATVTARARRARARRRRTTVLTAAAAVALVAGSSALWLGRSPGSSPTPSHQLSSAPTSPPTQPSTPPAVSPASLPRGPKPAVDYLDGDTFIGISGQHVSLPSGVNSAVPARGGALVVASAERSSAATFTRGLAGHLSQIEPGGSTHDLGCGAMQFAISADQTESAYWQMQGCDPASGGTFRGGVLNTMGEAGAQGVATPPGLVQQPVGLLQGGFLANSYHQDGSPAGVWVFGVGTAPRRVPGLVRAEGVQPATFAISGRVSDGRSAVVDSPSGQVRWYAPDGWVLGRFSLDGRHVVAADTTGSVTRYRILDAADGHTIADVPQVAGTEVLDTAWSEDGSLMLVLDDHQRSMIVRCTVAGALSRATSLAADGEVAHYRFGTTS